MKSIHTHSYLYMFRYIGGRESENETSNISIRFEGIYRPAEALSGPALWYPTGYPYQTLRKAV
jgi:hypothetical protein